MKRVQFSSLKPFSSVLFCQSEKGRRESKTGTSIQRDVGKEAWLLHYFYLADDDEDEEDL